MFLSVLITFYNSLLVCFPNPPKRVKLERGKKKAVTKNESIKKPLQWEKREMEH